MEGLCSKIDGCAKGLVICKRGDTWTTMGPEPGSKYSRRIELHQKLLPVPVVRRPLQCEKSVVAQYEYLDSESIFRVNSGR